MNDTAANDVYHEWTVSDGTTAEVVYDFDYVSTAEDWEGLSYYENKEEKIKKYVAKMRSIRPDKSSYFKQTRPLFDHLSRLRGVH